MFSFVCGDMGKFSDSQSGEKRRACSGKGIWPASAMAASIGETHLIVREEVREYSLRGAQSLKSALRLKSDC
jgi:hypothetical protein